MKTSFFKAIKIAFVSLAVLGFSVQHSHAQLSLKGKGKGPAPYGKDFNDATGISGTYYALAGVEYKNKMGKTVNQKVLKFEFINTENGSTVNKLNIYYNSEGQNVTLLLDEKAKEKSNINVFKRDAYEIAELEKGVFIGAEKGKVDEVYAKDEAKLETYTMESAQAKYEQFAKEKDKAASEAKKAQLMGYEAYKNNLKKVVYVASYGHFNYQYMDKPTEKSEKFLKSQSMGNIIYMGAYFENSRDLVCSNCEFDFEYEMEGVKVSRVDLRSKSRKWSDNIKKMDSAGDRFCFNYGHIMREDKRWDYAFIYTLFQNKDKFQLGKSYKLNTKIYAYKDGNRTLMAEGSVDLIYDQNAKDKLEGVFRTFQDFMNE